MRKMQEHSNDEVGYLESDDYDILKKDKKGTNDFYIKIKFLSLYIKYVISNKDYFDNLTDSIILERRGTFEQKQQRRNLKMLQILKTDEGMENYRNMVLAKLKLGMMEHANLEQEFYTLGIIPDEPENDDIIETDDIDDNEFYNTEKKPDDFLDPNFTDGIIIYESDDDDAEDADYVL